MSILIDKILPRNREAIQNVGDMLSFLREDYPNFRQWYHRITTEPELLTARDLFVAYSCNSLNRQIAAVMILKHTVTEKKICTLCVFPPYQRQCIGTELMNIACTELNTSTPLITVSESHHKDYIHLLQQFDFKLFSNNVGYYKNGQAEYSYNGPIETSAANYYSLANA